MNNNNTF